MNVFLLSLVLFALWTIISFIYVFAKPHRKPEGIEHLHPMKVVWMFFWSLPFLLFTLLITGLWGLWAFLVRSVK